TTTPHSSTMAAGSDAAESVMTATVTSWAAVVVEHQAVAEDGQAARQACRRQRSVPGEALGDECHQHGGGGSRPPPPVGDGHDGHQYQVGEERPQPRLAG